MYSIVTIICFISLGFTTIHSQIEFQEKIPTIELPKLKIENRGMHKKSIYIQQINNNEQILQFVIAYTEMEQISKMIYTKLFIQCPSYFDQKIFPFFKFNLFSPFNSSLCNMFLGI